MFKGVLLEGLLLNESFVQCLMKEDSSWNFSGTGERVVGGAKFNDAGGEQVGHVRSFTRGVGASWPTSTMGGSRRLEETQPCGCLNAWKWSASGHCY